MLARRYRLSSQGPKINSGLNASFGIPAVRNAISHLSSPKRAWRNSTPTSLSRRCREAVAY